MKMSLHSPQTATIFYAAVAFMMQNCFGSVAGQKQKNNDFPDYFYINPKSCLEKLMLKKKKKQNNFFFQTTLGGSKKQKTKKTKKQKKQKPKKQKNNNF